MLARVGTVRSQRLPINQRTGMATIVSWVTLCTDSAVQAYSFASRGNNRRCNHRIEATGQSPQLQQQLNQDQVSAETGGNEAFAFPQSSSLTQAPPLFDELTAAATKAIPFKPSSMVGNSESFVGLPSFLRATIS